jgi:hypothetical protein
MADHPPDETLTPGDLVAAFEATTLPFAIWQRHATHLRVSLWYLLHLPFEPASERIRLGIPRYNAAHGRLQTPTGGYHETLTRAFIHLIAARLTPEARQKPFDALCDELLADLGSSQAVLAYYSRERLNSWEARTGWVPPDRQPLPPLAGG